jgi:AcrR family transcriptional regulator
LVYDLLTTVKRSPGPAPSLTREQVVEAALDLVDEAGLAALSMRTLAKRLGVSAMTPYGYLASKADLVDALAQQALTAFAREARSDAPWRDQLRDEMRALHDVLARHPGVVELLVGGDEPPRLADVRHANIALLQAAGLSRSEAVDALRTLISYVVGHNVMARRRRDRDASFARGLEMVLASIGSEHGA